MRLECPHPLRSLRQPLLLDLEAAAPVELTTTPTNSRNQDLPSRTKQQIDPRGCYDSRVALSIFQPTSADQLVQDLVQLLNPKLSWFTLLFGIHYRFCLSLFSSSVPVALSNDHARTQSWK